MALGLEYASQSLIESAHDIEEGGPDRLSNVPNLDNVQPALARFVLAHERLRHTQPFSHLNLGQPGFSPQSAQERT
jgi:hypothetical protein